jgi:hypothetical protein
MGQKSGSGYGMNNPDHISQSLETIFWAQRRKFFDKDPGSLMEKFGTGINNSDPRCKCKSFSLFSLLCLPPLEAPFSIAVHTKALTPPHDTEGMGRKGGGGEVKMIFIVRSPPSSDIFHYWLQPKSSFLYNMLT